MKVDLLGRYGDDYTVCDAARVSFDKQARNYTEAQNKKLLKYLAEHNHWSPFAHPQISFRIKAPIFVARQLGKHQIGLTWNEVSRRYVNDPPEFYHPDAWRKAAANVKQGSSAETIEPHINIESYYKNCAFMYDYLLKQGSSAEQARMVLPQAMYTSWIWTGSLYAFSRIANLRLHPQSQVETAIIVQRISDIMGEMFPFSWEVLTKDKAHG